MSAITINKLLKTTSNTEDNKKYFYVQIKWEHEEIGIKIMDSETDKSYQGVVKSTAMEEIASNLDISYEAYYEEVRSALSTYLSLPGFYYKLEQEVFNVWKSQPESIPILFLDINIKELKSKYEILDSAIELLQQQDKSLTNKVEKAHKFDEHSRELLEDYRMCVDEKKEIERRLLRKVSVLLNAKKERIAQLEERLKKFTELENDTGTEESEDVAVSNKKRLVVDSESENDDYMADTQPLTMHSN